TDMVLDYISQNPQYKACIGLLRTHKQQHGVLQWGAVHRYSGHHYVPFLSSIEKLDPEAYWAPLTPETLHSYLKYNGSDTEVFLLSEQQSRPQMLSVVQ
ncbi:MAG: hypothetical protein P8X74_16410, partial [Reinekea sp.]